MSVYPDLFVPQQPAPSTKPNPAPGTQQSDVLYGLPTQFSFADVTSTILLPFQLPAAVSPPQLNLPGLTLLSLSTHRDKYPVTGLGRRGIRGFTFGHRTSAGTLGFNIFGESPWANLLRAYGDWRGLGQNLIYTKVDEMPPFDLSLIFMAESGENASVFMRSVTIIDSATNISVHDIQLTDVYSFMAAEVTTLIRPPGQVTFPVPTSQTRVPRPASNPNPNDIPPPKYGNQLLGRVVDAPVGNTP